jgi:hypothetical protein
MDEISEKDFLELLISKIEQKINRARSLSK